MVDLQSILGFTEHAPLAVLGLLLIGLSGWQSFVILRRLSASGYRLPSVFAVWSMIGTMPLAYLHMKNRSERGWSAWLAYLIWVSTVAGIASLAAGLFRLVG